MKLSDLPDEERLIIGLRLRLKHVRLAIAEAEAGGAPEGFDFQAGASQQAMLADLRREEIEVRDMLRRHGADDTGALN